MAHIEGETIIGRPPEVVFDYVADERNEPKYNPHLISHELVNAKQRWNPRSGGRTGFSAPKRSGWDFRHPHGQRRADLAQH
jgi:hypothetical protein